MLIGVPPYASLGSTNVSAVVVEDLVPPLLPIATKLRQRTVLMCSHTLIVSRSAGLVTSRVALPGYELLCTVPCKLVGFCL